ncbi:hypothetical protein NM688_g3345 [Phlebia brevispora]|uniref:Uncharacterized protein n=1 Tax=Phlebia brevispora TaxID=194682 RepID=A0ACC1T5S5_9APHY|nr:hypothetical protein NM688_g3345 [Phlebia brevispora]
MLPVVLRLPCREIGLTTRAIRVCKSFGQIHVFKLIEQNAVLAGSYNNPSMSVTLKSNRASLQMFRKLAGKQYNFPWLMNAVEGRKATRPQNALYGSSFDRYVTSSPLIYVDFEQSSQKAWPFPALPALTSQAQASAAARDQCADLSPQYAFNVLSLLPTVILAVFSALRVFALLDHAYTMAAFTFLIGLVPIAWDFYLEGSQTSSYSGSLRGPGYSCYFTIPLSPTIIFTGKRLMPASFATGGDAVLAGALSALPADIITLVITWVKTYRHIRQSSAIGVSVGFSTVLLQYGSLYFVVLLMISLLNAFIMISPSSRIPYTYAVGGFTLILPNIVLSRFLINLRHVTPSELDTARFSQFSASNFRVPSLPSFIGNLGEPLAGDEDGVVAEEGLNVEICEECTNAVWDLGDSDGIPSGRSIDKGGVDEREAWSSTGARMSSCSSLNLVSTPGPAAHRFDLDVLFLSYSERTSIKQVLGPPALEIVLWRDATSVKASVASPPTTTTVLPPPSEVLTLPDNTVLKNLFAVKRESENYHDYIRDNEWRDVCSLTRVSRLGSSRQTSIRLQGFQDALYELGKCYDHGYVRVLTLKKPEVRASTSPLSSHYSPSALACLHAESLDEPAGPRTQSSAGSDKGCVPLYGGLSTRLGINKQDEVLPEFEAGGVNAYGYDTLYVLLIHSAPTPPRSHLKVPEKLSVFSNRTFIEAAEYLDRVYSDMEELNILAKAADQLTSSLVLFTCYYKTLCANTRGEAVTPPITPRNIALCTNASVGCRRCIPAKDSSRSPMHNAADLIVTTITWIKTYCHVRDGFAIGVQVSFSATLLKRDVLPVIDAPSTSEAVRLSHFSAVKFHKASIPTVIGNLGEPLADGAEDDCEDDGMISEAHDKKLSTISDSGASRVLNIATSGVEEISRGFV